jgi:AdoMet-dependent heme synthase
MSANSDLPANDPQVPSNGRIRVGLRAAALGGVVKGPGFRPRPLQVTWEMTRDCEWKPVSARTAARTRREPPHLATAEAFHLIEQVAAMHVPLLALTGGDPLMRPDLFPILEFAAGRSVRTSLTLLPTPKLDAGVVAELKAAGLMRAGFWLHGSTPALHDAYWGIAGLYRRTLDIIAACHEVQLPVQINTIVSQDNFHDLDPMFELLTRLDVALWNVFFFVPKEPEQIRDMPNAVQCELIFGKLYAASKRVHFPIKTTEGQHYERYVLQQRAREARVRFDEPDSARSGSKRVNDSRGYVFIDHKGEVYPSRFLPLSAGNITIRPLSELYSDSPLFSSLRDASRLKGKCGRCTVRNVCGGSRARAYAVTGDLFAPDPCCAYEP